MIKREVRPHKIVFKTNQDRSTVGIHLGVEPEDFIEIQVADKEFFELIDFLEEKGYIRKTNKQEVNR
ncbi:MAG: hypothetical protein ACOCTT_01310 [archaeon]